MMMQRSRWHPTPVLLPGESHGRRSLVGCSPGGHEELDTTERLHFHFSLSCIGEGNGNPLQSSCLENPRDGGAWWAAVCGVTQSWTQLKWLWRRQWHPTPVLLPGKSYGRRSLVGCNHGVAKSRIRLKRLRRDMYLWINWMSDREIFAILLFPWSVYNPCNCLYLNF